MAPQISDTRALFAPLMPQLGSLCELSEVGDGWRRTSNSAHLSWRSLSCWAWVRLFGQSAQRQLRHQAKKTYVAFFLGQGGYIFSWGIPYLAAQAQSLGIETEIFRYYELRSAWKTISQKKAEGYKIGLVGYSLGNTTATYLQKHLEVDLVLAVAQSSLGRNHLIKKRNTRRSVLWYGSDFLSNAGLRNGFDEINYVYNTHSLMDVDPRVVKPVLDELQDLAQLEKSDRTKAASRTNNADNQGRFSRRRYFNRLHAHTYVSPRRSMGAIYVPNQRGRDLRAVLGFSETGSRRKRAKPGRRSLQATDCSAPEVRRALSHYAAARGRAILH